MNATETLNRAPGVITEKPVTVTIPVYPKSKTERLLQRIWLKPKKKIFEVYPITLENVYRYSSISVLFKSGILSGEDVKSAVLEAIVNHFEDMVYVVAVCLQNNRKEPAEDLLNLIKQEFTAVDMQRVLTVVQEQMNLKDFMNSIILIKSADVLTPPKMSRAAGEIIALGE